MFNADLHLDDTWRCGSHDKVLDEVPYGSLQKIHQWQSRTILSVGNATLLSVSVSLIVSKRFQKIRFRFHSSFQKTVSVSFSFRDGLKKWANDFEPYLYKNLHGAYNENQHEY